MGNNKKNAVEFVSLADIELRADGSLPEHFEEACLLDQKGLLEGLAEAKVPWSAVEKRYELARPYANVAATMAAKALGMSVVAGEGFHAPHLEKTVEGEKITLPLFNVKEALMALLEAEDDAKEAVQDSINAYDDWYGKTVPGFYALSFLMLEGRSIADVCKLCLVTSHEACRKLKDEHRAQYLRSFKAAIDRGDIYLALLAAGVSNREAKEKKAAYEELCEKGLIRNHFFAKSTDSFARAALGYLAEEDKISECNGMPVAPSIEEIKKRISEIREACGWSWNYVLNFFPDCSDELAAEITGLTELLESRGFGGKEKAAEFVRQARELPNSVKLSPYKDCGLKSYTVNGYELKSHNLAQAFWVKMADAAACFNEKKAKTRWEALRMRSTFAKAAASEMELEDKTLPAMGGYARAIFKNSGVRISECKPVEILKELILMFYNEDSIASLPDGNITWISMPNFNSEYIESLDEALGKQDTILGVSISGKGHNLFGCALAELRNEIRAKIDAEEAAKAAEEAVKASK